jgi:tetratricopeptide (TPR) repeat protein
VAHINLGVLYYVQGMWSTAVEHYRQADMIERENGFVAERAVNLRNLGLLHIGMGNHQQARHDYETSLAISKQIGDNTGIGCCQIGLAHLAYIQSRLDDAERHIHEAQEQAEALGEDHFLQLLLIQARIHAQTGALQAGFELASQVLQMAQASGLSEEEVDAYRILGALYTHAADYGRAESLLQQSLELARERRNPYQQGVALLELGRLFEMQARERPQQRIKLLHKAEDVLAGAIEAFERLGAAYDLQMTQVLLQQIREASLPLHYERSDPCALRYLRWI